LAVNCARRWTFFDPAKAAEFIGIRLANAAPAIKVPIPELP
jgi:hypothetical protein